MGRYSRMWLMLCMSCLCACASRAEPGAQQTAAARPFRAPPIDSLFIYARRPTEEVVFSLRRKDGGSRMELLRPARDGKPARVLAASGPGAPDAEEVVTMLRTFDVWSLNAPNAPGASCRTVKGQRKCIIAFQDYSIVMLVSSRGRVRVQRYIGLDEEGGHAGARALGDYLLAWAQQRDTLGVRSAR